MACKGDQTIVKYIYMYYNLSSSQIKSETLASKVYQVQAFTMKPE